MTGFGKDGRGVILYDHIRSASIGALAAHTVQSLESFYDDSADLIEDFRMLRADIFSALSGLTQSEGPLLLGLASADLGDTEILECLEAHQTGPDDIVANERAHRPVWPIAILSQHGQASQVAGFDGRPIVWDKRWTFNRASGWRWFVYNMRDVALTTGADLMLVAKIYGVWVR